LSYHYSHAQKYKEKELFYKVHSAQKVLKLGYIDDVYSYLYSAVTLTVDIEQLTDILHIVQSAILTIVAKTSIGLHSSPQTPQKAALTAELPTKFTHLETNVKEKINVVKIASS
jgi:hypothetical protein